MSALASWRCVMTSAPIGMIVQAGEMTVPHAGTLVPDAGRVADMAGKRFDPEQALQAAMQVFWTRGYEQASAQELVEAMRVNRGSWYATFGSKADLYRL